MFDKSEIGHGRLDFHSFMFRMGLYKNLKNKKVHFVTLEMNENELRRRLLKRFNKMQISLNKKEINNDKRTMQRNSL